MHHTVANGMRLIDRIRAPRTPCPSPPRRGRIVRWRRCACAAPCAARIWPYASTFCLVRASCPTAPAPGPGAQSPRKRLAKYVLPPVERPCREAHRGRGGVCRISVAWRATRGGREDRICNPSPYGVLTEAQLGAYSVVIMV